MHETITSHRFGGRIAIVTAAASGIGRSTAERLLDEGATVFASDIDLDALREAFTAYQDDPHLTLGALDVSEYEPVRAYVAAFAEAHDHLDVVVNAAGQGSWGSVDKLSVERWNSVLAVTLNSVFYMCKETVPLLIRSGAGAIVNVSSMSGLFGDNGFAAYNAAKAAVINLTRTLAVDHAPAGIRANAVCPGLTDTPRVQWMKQTPAIDEGYAARIALGRPARPDEIASAIAFLASADASSITGVALPIDGGMSSTVQPHFLRLLPDRV